MKNFSISLVLPAFNEEKNIQQTLNSSFSYLEKNFSCFEVIVVNDGSTDKTKQIVENFSKKRSLIKLVNHEQNRGYGSALKSGFENASCDFIFLMDSDGQLDINDLDLLLYELKENVAVVGYRQNRADNLVRIINQNLYNQFIEFVFGLKLRDIGCAFKVFAREMYLTAKPLVSEGALLNAELLLKFKDSGMIIKEVAVSHFPRKYGKSTGADLNVIFRMFIESWHLKRNYKKLKCSKNG